jgi:poly-gamma-glutamate capsule biosynthesis protein CapA/YwtB (metallophosphatase superfamily)
MAYEHSNKPISMSFTGDSMISRALMPFREERFLKIRDLLHETDVRFTNGEMLFHNYEDSPTYYSQTYMRCNPKFIKDLQWFGINLMGCANNHCTDFGENGVLTNIKYLDEAEMVHAGTGKNYADAHFPAYLDTPKGRVALISATSSARPNARAGDQRPDMIGRPGVNLIRWMNEWSVDRETLQALHAMSQQFGWRQSVPSWLNRAYGLSEVDAAQTVYLQDRNTLGVGTEDPAARFVLGSSFERHTRIHQHDLQRNLQSISNARRMADWVVFTMHSHEGGGQDEEPADHILELAHAAIDAGADVFIGHGPHLDRGIEIYKGKPILYSLGAFIIENDTVERMPQDSMVLYGLGHDNVPADLFETRRSGAGRQYEGTDPHHQSAVAVISFDSNGLLNMKLHPIEFGSELPRTQSGRPQLAEGNGARETLERFQRLSKLFGTQIEIQGNVGIVKATSKAPQ